MAGCGPKALVRRGGAWTAGDTDTELFTALTEAVGVCDYASFKATLEVRANSGTLLRRLVQYSDDGITWGTATTFGTTTFVSVAGYYYGESFTGADASKRLMRFGVGSKNQSGSNVNVALITMTLDLVPQ